MGRSPEKKQRSAAGRGAAVVGRVFAVIGKILGTFLLVGVLTALVFACLFARYVKSDLSKQTDFSLDNFTLDQTGAGGAAAALRNGKPHLGDV